MASEFEIKEYADKICQKYTPGHYTQIGERNKYIIKKLMSEFAISYEYAKYCFEHNKDR